MSKGVWSLVIVMLLASWAPSTMAQFSGKSQFSRLPGVGFMTVAVDEDHLVIILETSAGNLLGFDHAPTTSLQKKLVADTVSRLNNSNQMIGLPMAAACRPIDTEVSDPFDGRQDSGYEFYLSYEFKCKQATAINKVSFNIFNHHPRLKMIKVQWLSSSNMGYATLNRSRKTLVMY